MNANLLKTMTVELNGRTLYPELEGRFEQYAKDLTEMLEGIRKISKDFPLDLEPAPVFAPQGRK